MRLELWLVYTDGSRIRLKSLTTNQDGRTDQPLLSDDELSVGTYELVFAVGEYFVRLPQLQPQPLPEPPFLNQVPIRFGIADPNAHYHVPLLVSPWAYSTYRGS
jgi:5-hydroxyisourate hydrolase